MKTIFMTKEQWEKWDNALRSGEFEQAQGTLHNQSTGGYCCLGVLQKVLSGKVEHDRHGDPLALPSPNWLEDNRIRFLDSDGCPFDGPWLSTAEMYAAEMNDSDVDFITIADHIKQAVQFTD